MSIKEFRIDFTGQQLNPRFGHLHTTDTNAAVATAGYLNPFVLSQSFSILTTDFIFVAASDGNHIYTPSISAGVITLVLLV